MSYELGNFCNPGLVQWTSMDIAAVGVHADTSSLRPGLEMRYQVGSSHGMGYLSCQVRLEIQQRRLTYWYGVDTRCQEA